MVEGGFRELDFGVLLETKGGYEVHGISNFIVEKIWQICIDLIYLRIKVVNHRIHSCVLVEKVVEEDGLTVWVPMVDGNLIPFIVLVIVL